jgi:two-component system LytT family response regulator
MRVIRACIADDEPPARRSLEQLLSRQADISIVGSCGDGLAAAEIIATQQPDVVFLDVQMPGGDGFDVLARLPATPPVVIFVTAFDHYAVRAFEAQALDYLLKPFADERFEQVLARIRERLRTRNYDALAARLGPPPLVVRDGSRTHVIPVRDIEWIEAEDYYARIHAGDRRPLVRRSLASLLSALEPHGFVRVHRSAVVNLTAVRHIDTLPSGDAQVTLAGGDTVRVSRTHRPALDARL